MHVPTTKILPPPDEFEPYSSDASRSNHLVLHIAALHLKPHCAHAFHSSSGPLPDLLPVEVYHWQEQGKCCQYASINGEATQEPSLFDPRRGTERHCKADDAAE